MYDNINLLIGNTPLVRLNTFSTKESATIWGKCDFLNPSGSCKDRMATFILEEAIKSGKLQPGGTLIEATAGNTGLAFAMLAVKYKIKCIFVVPDKFFGDKINMLKAYGAEIVTTPTNVSNTSPEYYVNIAKKIHKEIPGSFYVDQYFNLNNTLAYYKTLGPELYQQTNGKIDAFIAGVGSGGSLSGTAKYLKEKNPDIKAIAADPIGSIYHPSFYNKTDYEKVSYKVEGIGQDILCKTIDFDHIDEIQQTNDKESFQLARKIIAQEGLFVGGSSGAAMQVAIETARKLGPGKNVVAFLCDSADRYVSKFLNDNWMVENGFKEDESTEEKNNYGFATQAIHSGLKDKTYNSSVFPIYQTSTFSQPTPGKFVGNYDYARGANPTRTSLELSLAKMENAKYAACFSSGCAAIDAILHLLNSGDHVILSDDVYGGTFRIFDKLFQQLGVKYSLCNLNSLKDLQAAIQPETKMIWLETPSNPMLKILDIAEIRKNTSDHIRIVVDNTFATPYLQRPLEQGADLIVHSSTKYLGGHSDLIGGAVIGNDQELMKKIEFIQIAVGAVPAPFDCFLLQRSIKTLNLRMEAQCASAQSIAEHLERHSAVKQVIYPGLSSHPDYKTAQKQMKLPGAMISCIINGDIFRARKFLEQLKVFCLAESLGGVKSLIEHPAIMTHASIPQAQREEIGIVDGLIRISVGTEDISDLIQDLDQAFSATETIK